MLRRVDWGVGLFFFPSERAVIAMDHEHGFGARRRG